MADYNELNQLQPKLLFTAEFEALMPIMIPDGPHGTRAIFEVKRDTGIFRAGKDFPDPDFEATIVGPTTDWVTISGDGGPGVPPTSISLDIRGLLKVKGDDGPMIYIRIIGRSKRVGENVNVNQYAMTFETGNEKYKWLNNKILMGKGTRNGMKLNVDYYDF